jgi:hypothetical protein
MNQDGLKETLGGLTIAMIIVAGIIIIGSCGTTEESRPKRDGTTTKIADREPPTPPTPPAPEHKPSATKIEELIKQLSSDDWEIREKSTEELIKMGESAVKPLEEALKSEDKEVVFRADRILAVILLPKAKISTDKKVYELNEEITIKFNIINPSKNTLPFLKPRGCLTWRVLFKASEVSRDGIPLTPIKEARMNMSEIMKAIRPSAEPTPDDTVKIEPGEEKTFGEIKITNGILLWRQLIINQVADSEKYLLDKPGKYSLKMEYNLSNIVREANTGKFWIGRLESNTIEFEIK